jgi:Ca-activated chloride channel family protein
MRFQYPFVAVFAVLVGVGLALAYRALRRQRSRALAAAGFRGATTGGRNRVRQHVPVALFLVALTLLLLAAARPQGNLALPRAAGTVVLAFDVSNSMTATDTKPTRLAAAQAAAVRFVRAQPASVDVGVVAFDQGALSTKPPTGDHDQAIAAINRLHPAGGTSLGQAILASLSTIVGRQVSLSGQASNASAPALGYWGSATIVLLSDGENTGGPDAVAAAGLAANAGVHIETIGFGTTAGATITVDGYQMTTALDADELTQIAQTTAGTYHPAGDAQALDKIYKSLDLRITTKAQYVELTGATVVVAVLLLTIGGLLMITWYGRIL